jgi:tetratricopeptide (TPR) repeat protein
VKRLRVSGNSRSVYFDPAKVLQLTIFAVILVGRTTRSLAQFPTDVPDLSELKWDSMDSPNRVRLREAYDKARSNPQDGEATGQLGMVLQAIDQVAFAAQCYRRAQLLEPQTFRWTYYLGVAKQMQDDKSEALRLLRNAVEKNPDYLPARLRLADAWLASGNAEESARVYEGLVEQFPDSASSYYGLGRIQASKGQITSAVANLRKARELFPGFGAAYYALAMIFRDRGEPMEAQKLLAQFELHRNEAPHVADPLLEDINNLRVQANDDLTRGVRLLEEGHPDQAIREFDRALQNNPKLAQAHADLLSAYLELGDLDKAEEHYRHAVRLDPNLYQAHYNYGLLLIRQGKGDKAADAFRKTLEINPFYADAHNDLACLLAEQGNVDEAIRHFQLAIDNRPNFRDAYCNVGQIELEQGHVTRAIEHLLKAVALEDEKTSVCMLSLAKAYLRDGNRQKGIYYAQRAESYATWFRQTAVMQEIADLLRQLNGQE